MSDLLASLWPWMQVGARVTFAIALMMLSAPNFTATEAVAGHAAAKKTPAPKAAVLASGLMMWVGAILIGLGWHRFIGAGLVLLFLLPVSFRIHSYWKVADPGMRSLDRTQFWKNVALMGAALFIAVYSGWDWPMSLGH